MANKKSIENNSSDDEILYYLEAYAVHSLSKENAVTLESMLDSNHKEVSHSQIVQIGIMFQQLPELATHVISHQRTHCQLFC